MSQQYARHSRGLRPRVVVSRLRGSGVPEKIERELMKIIPKKDWFKLTYLLIDHGPAFACHSSFQYYSYTTHGALFGGQADDLQSPKSELPELSVAKILSVITNLKRSDLGVRQGRTLIHQLDAEEYWDRA